MRSHRGRSARDAPREVQVLLKSTDPKVLAELRKLKAEVDASSSALWALAGKGTGGTAAAGGSGVRAANDQSLMVRRRLPLEPLSTCYIPGLQVPRRPGAGLPARAVMHVRIHLMYVALLRSVAAHRAETAVFCCWAGVLPTSGCTAAPGFTMHACSRTGAPRCLASRAPLC